MEADGGRRGGDELKRLCLEVGCPNTATAKGRCDFHRRQMERERSTARRGGYQRGPYKDATDARDADNSYRYPRRGREGGGGGGARTPPPRGGACGKKTLGR